MGVGGGGGLMFSGIAHFLLDQVDFDHFWTKLFDGMMETGWNIDQRKSCWAEKEHPFSRKQIDMHMKYH